MDDDSIVLDLDSMTLGELEVIEEVAGEQAVTMLMVNKMTAKALVAVAYVVKRRDNPAFSLADARALRVTSLKQPDPEKKGNGNGA